MPEPSRMAFERRFTDGARHPDHHHGSRGDRMAVTFPQLEAPPAGGPAALGLRGENGARGTAGRMSCVLGKQVASLQCAHDILARVSSGLTGGESNPASKAVLGP